MKIRSNFYVDSDRVEALKELAKREDTSISDLVREGIDRVISERLNNPMREREVLRTNLQEFLNRFAGHGEQRALEEIDDLVRRKAKRRQTV